MFIIATPTKRLCQDGLLREFASFGTFKECVKVYKRVSIAARKARHLNAMRGFLAPHKDKFMIIEIKEGMSINAAGQVIKTEPAEPGFEKVTTVSYSEILIPL